MTLGRLFVLLVLLIGGVFVGLVNGQPIFYYDTVAYVQGPDAAIGRLLGDNFRSRWTRKINTSANPGSVGDSQMRDRPKEAKADSEGTIIESGRSIYYGMFLYLSYFITSHFWFAVFVHSTIFVYLSHTLICTCLNRSFHTFAWMSAAILALSPVAFLISFLMPDIFAAYLIIGAVILTVFWPSLPTFHRVLVGSITLFSVLSHVTHTLLLIGLICTIVGLRVFSRSRSLSFASIRVPLFVLVAIALGGFFGEWLYFQGVRLATGAAPIRPPHLMARLIDDGPGYRFLQNHCEKKIYIVCNYLDRMPMAEDDFLWLDDPKKGVFTPADRTTRQKLSQEQTSFVLDVLYFDPIGQLVASLRNVTKEFFAIGLDEFNVTHMKLWSYEEGVPTEYMEKLKHGRIVTSEKFLKVSERLYFGVYVLSIAGLFLIGLLWRLEKDGKPHELRHEQYQLMLTMVVTGVVLNAAICGVFGGIFTRYQTRVSWVLLLMLLLALNYTLELRRRATNSRVD